MKHIVLASLGLLVVVVLGVWLEYWLNNEYDSGLYSRHQENQIEIDFKVVGTATQKVDLVEFEVEVVKESIDQVVAVAECDKAAEAMLLGLSETKNAHIEPTDFNVMQKWDEDGKTSKVVVTRGYEIHLSNISSMEMTIGAISKVEGCMIKATDFRLSRASDLRRAALADGKKRIDEYCKALTENYAADDVIINSVNIDEDGDWDEGDDGSGGGAMFAGAPSKNERLHHVQFGKKIKAEIAFTVNVTIVQ